MSDRSTTRKGLLLGALAYTCWGLLSPGNEILLRQWSPMWMQVARAGLATLMVTLWLGPSAFRRVATMFQRRPGLVGALLVGTFASFGFFVLAQTRIPAIFATLGFYTSPLWTALLARSMLGERVGWAFVATVVALLGGGYLALTGGGALLPPDALGMFFAVMAGATWGLYAVIIRRHAPDIPWKDLLLASTLVGFLAFLVTAAMTEPLPDVRVFTGTTWMWTVIQAIIPTVLALALFQSGLRYAPASRINILVGFELGATSLFAMWLLGDRYTGFQWLGMAIVLVAVSAYLWRRDRIERAGSDDAGDQETAHAE